jgi:hypothetical protein
MTFKDEMKALNIYIGFDTYFGRSFADNHGQINELSFRYTLTCDNLLKYFTNGMHHRQFDRIFPRPIKSSLGGTILPIKISQKKKTSKKTLKKKPKKSIRKKPKKSTKKSTPKKHKGPRGGVYIVRKGRKIYQ